jgi:hypothetical protein
MADNQERSIGELLNELATQTTTLFRQELALAKVEIAQAASRAGRNVGYLAVGGAVAYAAVLVFAAMFIVLLAHVIPWWAAALVVGIALGVIAAVLVVKALAAFKEMDLAPRQTIETLKEDAQWAKHQMR